MRTIKNRKWKVIDNDSSPTSQWIGKNHSMTQINGKKAAGDWTAYIQAGSSLLRFGVPSETDKKEKNMAPGQCK